MTRKRLRYSELAETKVVAPSPVPLPAVSSTPEIDTAAAAQAAPKADVDADAVTVAEPLAVAAAVPTPVVRPRRDSTPVELARALAAARAAEHPEAAAPAPGRATQLRAAFRTMRERARARVGVVEFLLFRIAGERFAIELLAVDEVIDLPVIHHVPEMPPAMLGVVTVRGSLTPVYSPQSALGLPLALREAVLIFRRGGSRIGVLIDDVEDAVSLDLRELRDAPGADGAETVVLGVMRHADALIGIVDADALIAACQTAALLEIA